VKADQERQSEAFTELLIIISHFDSDFRRQDTILLNRLPQSLEGYNIQILSADAVEIGSRHLGDRER
jgi:hypothetical protein